MSSQTDTVQTDNSNTLTRQPMGVGEILDITFSIYRQHFLLFWGIIAVYFFGNLVTYSLDGFLQDSSPRNLLPNLTTIPFLLVSMGGVIIATATIYLGADIPTSTDTLKQTLSRFWHLLGGYLLWTLALVIPLFAAILVLLALIPRGTVSVPALFIPLALAPFSIYFAVRWGFVAEVLLLEKTNVINAFKRSSELVRGTWWRVFGMIVLILLLSTAIHFILEVSLGTLFILAKAAGGTDLRTLIQWSIMETELSSGNLLFYAVMTCTDLILKTFVFPIWVIGIVLLYFDLRIRKEGFDIETQVNNTEAIPILIQ